MIIPAFGFDPLTCCRHVYTSTDLPHDGDIVLCSGTRICEAGGRLRSQSRSRRQRARLEHSHQGHSQDNEMGHEKELVWSVLALAQHSADIAFESCLLLD